jgi:hypothetical protein
MGEQALRNTETPEKRDRLVAYSALKSVSMRGLRVPRRTSAAIMPEAACQHLDRLAKLIHTAGSAHPPHLEEFACR